MWEEVLLWFPNSIIYNMGRSKLDKFKDNELSNYIIQPGKEIFEHIKGNWRKLYFKNQNKLVLELACGRGEYTIGLARQFPVQRHGDGKHPLWPSRCHR